MKPAVRLNEKYLSSFLKENETDALQAQIRNAHEMLHDKTGPGSDFLGWLDLPETYCRREFDEILKAAKKIREDSDVLIVIGIGGSYMGARAAIEFLNSPYYNNLKKEGPDIYFVGNSISPSQLYEILALCEDKDVSVNVISKSGTTTEPAVAFRFFHDFMIRKYGKEEAKNRIYCTTDRVKGTMKKLADQEGYQTFSIPDDVGGRYSVLTAVGLLPIAVSGSDIGRLMEGAKAAMEELSVCDLHQNDCYRYAALRNLFYRQGKAIELLVSYEPGFAMMAEWYKQLFGESEGKEGKGLFPATATFSTDLHSMGQFIQEGSKVLFETVVNIVKPRHDLQIKASKDCEDGLDFLVGRNMSEVNQIAFDATAQAHVQGEVPVVVLEMEQMDEFNLGYLIYFFEKACAISGYLLGINPFDQPGVEAYKKNMFALLGKPGYESLRDQLLKELH